MIHKSLISFTESITEPRKKISLGDRGLLISKIDNPLPYIGNYQFFFYDRIGANFRLYVPKEIAGFAKYFKIGIKELLSSLKNFDIADDTNSFNIKIKDNTFYFNENRELDRKDGPAILNNEYKAWFLNGKKHREGGPAIEWDNGTKHWYLNGQLHRKDGPAVEYDDGRKEWYLNDKRHREDGPAIEYSNGDKYWYLRGKLIQEYDFVYHLSHKKPNPNLFIDLPIEDLEELIADLSDKYLGEVKQWKNFYAIYFEEKLDMNDPDLKSFENRIKDFRIRVNNKSILVY